MQPTLWQQIYDPFGNMIISTLLGAIPVVVMLVGLGFLHLKAHIAAGAGLLVITHDPAIAARAGRTVRMADGHLHA